MTEQQQLEQRVDMLQLEVHELRDQINGQIKAFTIAIDLIRDILEKKNGGK